MSSARATASPPQGGAANVVAAGPVALVVDDPARDHTAKKRKFAQVDDDEDDNDNDDGLQTSARKQYPKIMKWSLEARYDLMVKVFCALTAQNKGRVNNMRAVRALYANEDPNKMPSVNTLSKQVRSIKNAFPDLLPYFDGTKKIEDLVEEVKAADQQQKMARDKFQDIQTQFSSVTEQVQDLLEDELEYELEDEIEEELEDMKIKLAIANKRLEKLQKQIQKKELTDMKTKLANVNKQIQALLRQQSNYEAEIKQAEPGEQLEEDLEDEKSELANANEQL